MTNAVLLLTIVLAGPDQIGASFSNDVRADVLQATVRIVNIAPQRPTVVGTGVALNVRGKGLHVLTAQHVVDNPGMLEVHTYSLSEFPRPAKRFTNGVEIVAIDENSDLALLRVRTDHGVPRSISLCPLDAVPSRFTALASGCSLSEPPLLWTIAVDSSAAVQRTTGRARFWVTNREPFNGESGGPLVDSRGRLLGICSMGRKDRGLYTHVQEIYAFLKQNGF